MIMAGLASLAWRVLVVSCARDTMTVTIRRAGARTFGASAAAAYRGVVSQEICERVKQNTHRITRSERCATNVTAVEPNSDNVGDKTAPTHQREVKGSRVLSQGSGQ